MFKLSGVPVSACVLDAVVAGKVIAKSGPGARVVSRDAAPRYFRVVIVVYLALSVALVTYF